MDAITLSLEVTIDMDTSVIQQCYIYIYICVCVRVFGCVVSIFLRKIGQSMIIIKGA